MMLTFQPRCPLRPVVWTREAIWWYLFSSETMHLLSRVDFKRFFVLEQDCVTLLKREKTSTLIVMERKHLFCDNGGI